MTKIEFSRIAFGNWERSAQGIIEGMEKYLEIKTADQTVLSFLRQRQISGEIVSNPTIWVGETYHVYAGSYQVIHMDDEGTALRKIK